MLKIFQKILLIIFILFSLISLSSPDTFQVVDKIKVGERTFHIDIYGNYATICNYSGTVKVVDYVNGDVTLYVDNGVITRPMAGYYINNYLYVIDNGDPSLKVINKWGSLSRKLKLKAKPVNMKFSKDKFYVATTNPYGLYIINKTSLKIEAFYEFPVKSPFISLIDNDVLIPMYENEKNNIFTTYKLLFRLSDEKFIMNLKRISFPIDIERYNGKYYLGEYFEGGIYEFWDNYQKKIAQFGKYLTNIGIFNNNIIGNSLFGGIYIYSLKDKSIKVILKDIPITDFAYNTTNDFLFAISHITGEFFVIDKNFNVYERFKIDDYPIDIEVPTDNIILVLSTDGQVLNIIRRF
ncbi:hypothetical protein SAMN02745164_00777 [Marinitoga hydrogenitolerans DSM 16785]|uniref:Uncharacterized protein n=1 Tax=Marinitoga hydrogenitolerans (strain DSM 16785 / JCM 12826 / AT1271) TaxID=1122195 RepID=A0A1M4UXE0_MARH1|nr:hypothetical protein [Marinitoga hydrogenitolerans]SHE61386.1 hypothetical protein SAMN02745164_00777 [Marinitoga hydrogenitolerans DSM 16785]